MMVNNIALLRAGEFARVFALTRQVPAVSFSTGFASLIVDRVFDAVVVLLLLAVSVFAAGFSATTQIGGYSLSHLAFGFAVVPLVMLVALYALVFFPTTLIRLFELMARRVSPGIERRGGDMLRRFADGLSVLRSPGHFIVVFWWTLLHWLLQPLAFWLSFRAFGIVVPWSAALFVQGVIVILVALPGAPGFFGHFEFGATIGLALYGIADRPHRRGRCLPRRVVHSDHADRRVLLARLGLSMGEMKAVGADKRDARRPRFRAGEDQSHPPRSRARSERIPLDRVGIPPARPRRRGHGSNASGRTLDCHGPPLPTAGLGPIERNLAFRAALAYADAVGWPSGFSIDIDKRIPVGAGLGGGSADAGAVLRALDALCPTPLGSRLIELAAPLGADVPFMTIESPMALAWGRGERLFPLHALDPRARVLIAMPDFGVSTADAYGWLALDRGSYEPMAEVIAPDSVATWEGSSPSRQTIFSASCRAGTP